MHRIILVVPCLAFVFFASSAYGQWTYTPEIGRFINLKNMPRESPELQIEYARSLMLESDYRGAAEEVDKFDEFYNDSDLADQNQFLKGDIRLARKQYQRAAEEYQLVISEYPSSPLYDDVTQRQYEIGDYLHQKGVKRYEERDDSYWNRIRFFFNFTASRPFKQAIEVYEMVTDNQPFSPEAAEAQFRIGMCYEVRDRHLEAADEYRRVIEDYPDSPWVREAVFGVTQSYIKTSNDPEYDQAPSLFAIKWIEEFKARYAEDSRNEDMATIAAEMWGKVAEQRYQSARFYERRREMVAARSYYVIVAEEHAETQAGEKARDWLRAHPLQDTLQSRFLRSLVDTADE